MRQGYKVCDQFNHVIMCLTSPTWESGAHVWLPRSYVVLSCLQLCVKGIQRYQRGGQKSFSRKTQLERPWSKKIIERHYTEDATLHWKLSWSNTNPTKNQVSSVIVGCRLYRMLYHIFYHLGYPVFLSLVLSSFSITCVIQFVH